MSIDPDNSVFGPQGDKGDGYGLLLLALLAAILGFMIATMTR